ncbi:MAG: hypothetical protein K0R47_3767 [Brevibacillus sp.]|nr:hypothetical protein [Brevibacillus sp.]
MFPQTIGDVPDELEKKCENPLDLQFYHLGFDEYDHAVPPAVFDGYGSTSW